MTGELILENGGWKRRLPAEAATAVLALLVVWPAVKLMVRRGVHGLMLQISTAVLALILWWVLYPAVSRLFFREGEHGRVRWTLTGDSLTIGEDVIPLETVKTVHCWANRSALGTADGGLTINIETTGKNRVLRSVRSGAEAETSERLLRELVETLGYGARLPEKES